MEKRRILRQRKRRESRGGAARPGKFRVGLGRVRTKGATGGPSLGQEKERNGVLFLQAREKKENHEAERL